ncbi:MAG: DUF1152 domain-containing protein [Bacteroidota bacterium]
MTYRLDQIPLFAQLENCQNVLISGAGGGFDIFTGIPLYINLKKQGKNVILANFSFTWLNDTNAKQVFPNCYEIKPSNRDLANRGYFPEKYLKIWLDLHFDEKEALVYAFERCGVQPLKEAYDYLIERHEIDAIVLVDGGTDSLMFGDEEGLGTPHEDICSMAAVFQSKLSQTFLASIGFGIDHFHGVSHYRFLENVARISKAGGYMGMFQVLPDMEEGKKYKEAVQLANKLMIAYPSIVNNSIISAMDGEYGDYHATNRTDGSELWINPLMTTYWCFNLNRLIPFIAYYDQIKDSMSMYEVRDGITQYRAKLSEFRSKKQIPI